MASACACSRVSTIEFDLGAALAALVPQDQLGAALADAEQQYGTAARTHPEIGDRGIADGDVADRETGLEHELIADQQADFARAGPPAGACAAALTTDSASTTVVDSNQCVLMLPPSTRHRREVRATPASRAA